MQNLALDIISNIYYANETFVDMRIVQDIDKTICHMQKQKVFKDDYEKYHHQNKFFELKLTRATKIEIEYPKDWIYILV